ASVPGWETSAWLSEGAFCVRAARLKPQAGKPNQAIYCDPAPPALEEAGPPLLPMKPLPYLDPGDPRSEKIILVGAVRGDVATVSVTMFDETATAQVHRLPATGGRHVGAYAVWLPFGGPERDGTGWDDITAVVGRDSAGRVVAWLE
ncbi:MAG: hypothetical protein ACRDT1_05325, partial [Micromonosporaceae bacterium]